jgi:hypothetical protein
MSANSLVLAIHNTVMTGTLYKPGTSNTDVFMSAPMLLNYRMISTGSSYIVPPLTMADAVYIIKDPGMYHVLNPFTVIDTGGMLGTLELRQKNN